MISNTNQAQAGQSCGTYPDGSHSKVWTLDFYRLWHKWKTLSKNIFKVRLSQYSNKTFGSLSYISHCKKPSTASWEISSRDTNLCNAVLSLLWPWHPPFFKAWNLILCLEFMANSWNSDKFSVCFPEFPFGRTSRFRCLLKDSSHWRALFLCLTGWMLLGKGCGLPLIAPESCLPFLSHGKPPLWISKNSRTYQLPVLLCLPSSDHALSFLKTITGGK